MNTSLEGTTSYLLYAAIYAVALSFLLRRRPSVPRPTLAPAFILWLVVAVPSVIGLLAPSFSEALSRRPDLVMQGQFWRLFTSMVVQDGGLAGTLTNLIALAATTFVAMRIWKPVPTVLLFVAGGLGFNLVATFVWHAAGAGNSAATFFLLAATVARLIRSGTRSASLAVATVAIAGVVLVFLDDSHGVAVLGGLLVGGAVSFLSRPRGPQKIDPRGQEGDV